MSPVANRHAMPAMRLRYTIYGQSMKTGSSAKANYTLATVLTRSLNIAGFLEHVVRVKSGGWEIV